MRSKMNAETSFANIKSTPWVQSAGNIVAYLTLFILQTVHDPLQVMVVTTNLCCEEFTQV